VGGIAAMLALVLGLVVVVVVRPGPVDDWLGGSGARPSVATEPSLGPPSPVLDAASTDAPVPSAARVAAVLDPILRDGRLGGRVTASVVDAASGSVLYAKDPDAPTTPASTIKLVTAVTVLAARGPEFRIETVVVAGTKPGEVVLVGGGDPTLAAGATGTYPGAASVLELAKQVRQALGGTEPTKVITDSSLFTGGVYGPGWDDDIPTGGFVGPIMALMTDGARIDPKIIRGARRHGQPDLAAGRAFATALGVPTSAVARGKAPAPPSQPTTPAPSASPSVEPGTVLGHVESPPLHRLVEMMLVDSDNVLAETLARQVALARSQPASYGGAGTAMRDVLGELGLPQTEAVIADGSGLSRIDRVTPSLLTELVALATRPDRPALHAVFTGLPVAGYSGTLRDRYRSPSPADDAAGSVRAKTGTLRGVSAISGVVVTRDGRLLAFAILADAVPATGQSGAQEALDRAASALATSNLG
jgi:D-alanyl-D-alanine carboxypeptidase/D-alanyl-D-alanine-endopeptidase (penicillin-binding protein 4)